MLSLYGSKAHLVQAHMAPEQQRLQVSYRELFDFRNLTKDWLDIFVGWFLNEPLAASSSRSESSDPRMHKVSDGVVERLVEVLSKSQRNISAVPRRQNTAPQKEPTRPIWSPGYNSEEASLDQTGLNPPVVFNTY